MTAPGKSIDPGTIVVRRGIIEAVGLTKDVTVPYDAETIDGKGLVVYPGFIDLYTTIGQRAGAERSATGKGRPVDLAEAPLISTPPDNRKGLTPEFDVAGALELTDALAEPRRRLGFTDLLSAPSGAIATGQSALVSLSGLPRREVIVAAPIALHVHLAPPSEPATAGLAPRDTSQVPGPGLPAPALAGGEAWRSGRSRRKPLSPRLDGLDRPLPPGHARRRAITRSSNAYYEAHGGTQPPFDPALKALLAARTKNIWAVWWESDTRDEIHRALDLADEFGTTRRHRRRP